MPFPADRISRFPYSSGPRSAVCVSPEEEAAFRRIVREEVYDARTGTAAACREDQVHLAMKRAGE